MSRGVLSLQARRDIAEIWDYIAKYSEIEADSVIEDFNAKFRLLRKFPYLAANGMIFEWDIDASSREITSSYTV